MTKASGGIPGRTQRCAPLQRPPEPARPARRDRSNAGSRGLSAVAMPNRLRARVRLACRSPVGRGRPRAWAPSTAAPPRGRTDRGDPTRPQTPRSSPPTSPPADQRAVDRCRARRSRAGRRPATPRRTRRPRPGTRRAPSHRRIGRRSFAWSRQSVLDRRRAVVVGCVRRRCRRRHRNAA